MKMTKQKKIIGTIELVAAAVVLIAAVVFALVYLIAPVDVIPDFLPLVGYVDDTAVFGLLLAGFKSDIGAYRRWKEDNR